MASAAAEAARLTREVPCKLQLFMMLKVGKFLHNSPVVLPEIAQKYSLKPPRVTAGSQGVGWTWVTELRFTARLTSAQFSHFQLALPQESHCPGAWLQCFAALQAAEGAGRLAARPLIDCQAAMSAAIKPTAAQEPKASRRNIDSSKAATPISHH